MARFFIVDGKQLPDPDPRLTPDEVRAYLAANFYDWLANAESREERRGDDTHIFFTRRIGTKGGQAARVPPASRIRRLIRATPEKSLRVWDLAAALTLPNGDLDHVAAAARQPEVELALAECESNARATHAAAEALRRVRTR